MAVSVYYINQDHTSYAPVAVQRLGLSQKANDREAYNLVSRMETVPMISEKLNRI